MRTSHKLSLVTISIFGSTLACSVHGAGGGSGGGDAFASATATTSSVSTTSGCDQGPSTVTTTSDSSSTIAVAVTVSSTTGAGGGLGCSLHATDAGGVVAPASLAYGQSEDFVYVATNDPNEEIDGTGTIARVEFANATATILASGLSHPEAIAVDATSVYFATADGNVEKTPLEGGAVTVLASNEAHPFAIALAGGALIWGNRGDGAVKSVPIDGGATTVIYAPSGAGQVTDLAVDATSIYFTEITGGANAGVFKAPIGGGSATLLAASPRTQALAVDAGAVYFLDAITSAGDGAVRSVSIDGGAITTLVANLGMGDALTIDDQNVYWHGQSFDAGGSVDHAAAIFSVPKQGGGVSVLADDVLMFGHSLVRAQHGVTWADGTEDTIDRFRCF